MNITRKYGLKYGTNVPPFYRSSVQFVSSRYALHLSGRTTETLHAVGHADLGDETRGGTGLGAIDLIFEGIDHLAMTNIAMENHHV